MHRDELADSEDEDNQNPIDSSAGSIGLNSLFPEPEHTLALHSFDFANIVKCLQAGGPAEIWSHAINGINSYNSCRRPAGVTVRGIREERAAKPPGVRR